MSLLDTKRIPTSERWAASFLTAAEEQSVPPFPDALTDPCVDLAIELGMHQGVLLDVGTGAVAIRLAKRCPEVTVLAIVDSSAWIGPATQAADREGLLGRIHFQVADLRSTHFKSEYFDGVVCNEFLHRAAEPGVLLDNLARLVKRDGALLVRDLRRPSILSAWWHRRWFARRYPASLRKHFEDEIRSAFSHSEWRQLFNRSVLRDSAQVLVRNLSHLSIERPAKQSLFAEHAARQAKREFLVETEGWRKDL